LRKLEILLHTSFPFGIWGGIVEAFGDIATL